MARLFWILLAMIATTFMGIGIVAVLAIDQNMTWKPIVFAAAAGFVLSIPVTWLVARQIVSITKPRG